MKKSILTSLLAALAIMTGCRKSEMASGDLYAGMGRIDLALSNGDLIVSDEGTKADAQPSLSDITFEISGFTIGGVEVKNEEIFFTEGQGSAYTFFRAGTYTITATYEPDGAHSGNGCVCYRGTSQEFTVETAGTAKVDGKAGPIAIAMKLSNAKVNLIFDSSLDEFYDKVTVEFTSPREFSVNSSDSDTNRQCTLYLEAGRVAAYGVSAEPLSNSGAHNIEISGLYLPAIIQGSDPIFLEAGKEYTLTVKFAPGGIAIFLDNEQTPLYTTEETWSGLFS